MKKFLVILIPLFILAGCMTVGQHFANNGLERAAFELQCPKTTLELKALNVPLDSELELGAQVGVTGCGKRAVYILTSGSGWVLNSAQSNK
jgi:hypothetical protein